MPFAVLFSFFAMVLLVAINGIMAGLEKKQTKTTVEAQRKELAGVILGVLSDAAVSESGLFALWSQCGWRARDCLASAGQLPWIYGSVRSPSQSGTCARQRVCQSNVCALFLPAAEASLRPDWSCCTTSSPGTTTSPIVSPPHCAAACFPLCACSFSDSVSSFFPRGKN